MSIDRRQILVNSIAASLFATTPIRWRTSVASSGDTSPIRIGLVADPQYVDAPHLRSRYYKNSIAKLTEAVEYFNSCDLDFCVNLGDLVDREISSFQPMLEIIGQSKHPFFHVLGNHDFEVIDSEKRNVAAKVGMPSFYYSKSLGSWRFLFLDTNDISVYAYASDSAEHRQGKESFEKAKRDNLSSAQPWNGAIGEFQLRWIAEECELAAREAQRVLIFAHHPIAPTNHHNLWNADELLRTIELNRVVACWINGHNHAGNYSVQFDVPMITLHGMVETDQTNAYAILTLQSDRFAIEGFGREQHRNGPLRSM